jgi:hypothetical protein
MKVFFTMALLILSAFAGAQTLQFHYDFRHTLNPENYAENYPTLYFEYFKNSDTGKTVKKLGPFLLKTQADFTGQRSNIGQFYMQVFQQFRFWEPKIYVSLQYSGGLGVTDLPQYSYYIVSTYSIGISYPFKLGNAFVSAGIDYKYAAYQRPSRDLSYSFYFWKGLLHYKGELSGDFTTWTQNKNHGDDLTSGLKGKGFFFFAEPQLWYNLKKKFAVGSKINMYYHVLNAQNILYVFPTLAIRVKF